MHTKYKLNKHKLQKKSTHSAHKPKTKRPTKSTPNAHQMQKQ